MTDIASLVNWTLPENRITNNKYRETGRSVL